MTRHLAIMFALLLSGTAWAGDLPDPKLTPGIAKDDMTIAQVCATKSKDVERLVDDTLKRQVAASYHMTASMCPSGKIEIDHLWPHKMNGADAAGNLWPQCYEAPVLDPDPANTQNFDPLTHQLKTIDPKNPPPAYDKHKHPDGLVYLKPSQTPEMGAHKKDRLEDSFSLRICLPPSDPQYLTIDQARHALSNNWIAAYISNYGDPRAH